MFETKYKLLVLLALVMCIVQSVSSIQICSRDTVIARTVSLSGKQGSGTDCSCTLKVSSADKFAVNPINFNELRTPSGCQYALRFKISSTQRTYTCSKHGSSYYSMFNIDTLTIEIVPGSTSTGGFDFAFNITSQTTGSQLTLSCQQTPPDPTASTLTTPTTTTSTTSSTTTSTSSTSTESTSSGSGNIQTTASGGGTSAASDGGTSAASGGQTTSSGSGTTTSNNKPPTPKPSVSGGNTDEPQVILITTEENPSGTTKSAPVSTAAIIGATLGVILLFVVLVVVLLVLWKKKLNQNKVGAS